MPPRLSHTDARGQVRMVDVGAKPETDRLAVATAAVKMAPSTLALVMGDSVGVIAPPSPKGDVLATARLAAIAALKRTAELIPLCHPVRVVGTDVAIDGDASLPGVRIRVTVRAFDRTGVEMEAMVGAGAAALTIYDMVKGVERGVEITAVRLEAKSGGRSGTWRRPGERSEPRKNAGGETEVRPRASNSNRRSTAAQGRPEARVKAAKAQRG